MKVPQKANIFRKVLWFKNRQKFDIDFFDVLMPSRTVSDNPRYKSGLYHSEKCGRDIQYESGLELKFIENHLEYNDNVLFYWEQPTPVHYYRGKIRAKTYPDFAVYLKSREFVIVEVKPLTEMIDHRVQAKSEGILEFCSRRGFGFLLTDGSHTPEDLLKGKINRKLEKEIMSAVSSNPIRKAHSREILERCNANQEELYRTIIRLNLKFKPYPFKLQNGNQSPVFRQVYFEKKKYDEVRESNFSTLFKTNK